MNVVGDRAAKPGSVHLVGIGPGAPDLLTVRAVRVIQSADTLFVPRSERSDESLARRAIAPYVSHQEVIEHVYPMTPDQKRADASWGAVAEQVLGRYERGLRVAQVTLGDPLIYSTSYYLFSALRRLLPPEAIHIVPGVSAFQAAGARVQRMLTIQQDRLLLMPATDLEAVAAAFERCETLVLYKAGRVLEPLRTLLAKRGLLERSAAVLYAEQEGREVLVEDWSRSSLPAGYMTTVIVSVGRRPWA